MKPIFLVVRCFHKQPTSAFKTSPSLLTFIHLPKLILSTGFEWIVLHTHRILSVSLRLFPIKLEGSHSLLLFLLNPVRFHLNLFINQAQAWNAFYLFFLQTLSFEFSYRLIQYSSNIVYSLFHTKTADI